jgi:hypothetical protein
VLNKGRKVKHAQNEFAKLLSESLLGSSHQIGYEIKGKRISVLNKGRKVKHAQNEFAKLLSESLLGPSHQIGYVTLDSSLPDP